MAGMEMETTWVFKLHSHQALLVLKALGGRLKPEEVEEAKVLGDELTKRRSQLAMDLSKALEKNANKIA